MGTLQEVQGNVLLKLPIVEEYSAPKWPVSGNEHSLIHWCKDYHNSKQFRAKFETGIYLFHKSCQ